MHGRRKMSEFFCSCCCVHLSFFLSRFQNELQLYFHSRVVKRTTGRIDRFPLHRLFLFLFLRLCVGAEFSSGRAAVFASPSFSGGVGAPSSPSSSAFSLVDVVLLRVFFFVFFAVVAPPSFVASDFPPPFRCFRNNVRATSKNNSSTPSPVFAEDVTHM